MWQTSGTASCSATDAAASWANKGFFLFLGLYLFLLFGFCGKCGNEFAQAADASNCSRSCTKPWESPLPGSPPALSSTGSSVWQGPLPLASSGIWDVFSAKGSKGPPSRPLGSASSSPSFSKPTDRSL